MEAVERIIRPPQDDPAKWRSLALSTGVHALLIAALFLGVQWKSKPPSAVEVEVWRASPAPVVSAPEPRAEPSPEPRPEPKPESKPEPKPEPKPISRLPPPPEPKPAPKAEPRAATKELPKPEPKAEVRPPVKPEIPLKEDKKIKEPPKKEEIRAKEPPRKEEVKPKEEVRKPEPERRPNFAEELAREQKQLQQQKAEQKAAADQRARAEARERLNRQLQAEQAATAENKRGLAEYIDKVRAKIRGNITLPPGIQGNPQAIFEVTQLPTGEVLDVKLRSSSGNSALDAAVERAIRKSSPLPKPAQPELFSRLLKIPYKPHED